MKKQKRCSRSRIIGILLPALLAMALVACSSAPTYQEPVAKEPSQLATIQGSMVEGEWWQADQFTTVSRIDESVTRGASYDQPISVQPGHHTLTLYFREGNRYASVKMVALLEAGRSYVVKSEIDEQDWWARDNVRFWIEDANTGEPLEALPGSRSATGQ